jgi:hypothetical protein
MGNIAMNKLNYWCALIGYSLVALAAIVGGLHFVRINLGMEAVSWVCVALFGLCTLYLMYKNVMTMVSDGEASKGWLLALIVMFCMTVLAFSNVSNYFNIH